MTVESTPTTVSADKIGLAASVAAAVGPSTFARRVELRLFEICTSVRPGELEVDDLISMEPFVTDAGGTVIVPVLIGGRFLANDVAVSVEWNIDAVSWKTSPKRLFEEARAIQYTKSFGRILQNKVVALPPGVDALVQARVHTLQLPIAMFGQRLGAFARGQYRDLPPDEYWRRLASLRPDLRGAIGWWRTTPVVCEPVGRGPADGKG